MAAFPAILEAAASLEASPLGEVMRRSPRGYPAANLAHLLGLVLLVGGIGMLDIRVLGVGRRTVGLAALSRFLTPFGIAGLLLLLGGGFLMFAADASVLVANRLFQAKMALLALGLLNAALFRLRFGDLQAEPTGLAKVMALGSLAIWLTVAALGRIVGYA